MAALAVLAICGCADKGDPIRRSLDGMAKAAHNRDVGAFMRRVAQNFEAADGSGRADAEAMLRRFFDAYESLNVTIHDVSIERGENVARARFRAELSGRPRRIGGLDGLLPSSTAYDFDLRLVRDGAAWKVAWASWNPAGASPTYRE